MSDSKLSKAQRELGEKILNALTSIVKMPVSLHEWKYAPEIGKYELVITTSWVKDKGPDATSWALLDALDTAHIVEPTHFVKFEAPDSKTANAGS